MAVSKSSKLDEGFLLRVGDLSMKNISSGY
jgi:hypothetical protein